MRNRRDVGKHIRSARVERGWTQADLSHFSGVGVADISRIETGRLFPTRSQLERMADALGVRRERVISEEANPVA